MPQVSPDIDPRGTAPGALRMCRPASRKRLHPEGLPGNVRLDRRATGLTKPSMATVYDVQKVLRSDFLERLATLPPDRAAALDAGLRLVLDL